MSSYTPFSYGFTANSTCNLELTFTGKQGYSGNLTGTNPWDAYLYIDGTQIGHSSGSGAVTDNMIVRGVVTGCGPGSHTVSATWVCTSTYIQLSGCVFTMLTTNK